MQSDLKQQLLDLNQQFYDQRAGVFAKTRTKPQPGFYELGLYWPNPCRRMLDVGCGDGRYGRFNRAYLPTLDYVGIDFSQGLLDIAQELHPQGAFHQRDITQQRFLEGMGQFELISILAVLHHIPERATRFAILAELSEHLRENGRLFIATWQFLDSERQRRKLRDWSQLGVTEQQLDDTDYLMAWQAGGSILRYVCMVDEAELRDHAQKLGLRVVHQFRSDGREGDLSLYFVLEK